jgi:mRNA-degrading endonuclease RelE of RelBE toxin-antitoxin system
MNIFVFTKFALKKFYNLNLQDRDRVARKLMDLKSHSDIFFVLKHLKGYGGNYFRLRVGDIRIILLLKIRTFSDFIFWVIDVGHRKEIYR